MTTRQKKPITSEIATIKSDFIHDYIGKIVINPDKVLRTESGGAGIELYEDLLRDAQVSSTLQTRKLAVVGREWEIIPAGENREAIKVAEFVRSALLQFNFDAARQSLLSGIILGFKPAEVMWEYSEGSIRIKDIIGKASRRFVFDLDGNLRLITRESMVEGVSVPEKKFIVFRNISHNGSDYGHALGQSLYWPVWFKKHSLKFWMIFCEKFGTPTVVGKYPANASKEDKDKLMDALESFQQDLAIRIPNTMVMELLEATRAGSINTYESLCAHLNAEISKVILGQTLTTELDGKGSYAASRTHDDVRQDYIKADADSLCECLNNSVIQWLVDYNFSGIKGYPKIWIRTRPEPDLKQLAERDKILVSDIGLPVSKKYFYDTYGITQPGEGESLVTAPITSNPFGPAKEGSKSAFTEKSKCPVCFSDGIPSSDMADNLTENLMGRASLDPFIEQIKKLSGEVESLEELKDRLLDTYAGMDARDLGNLMQRALAAAELAGRFKAAGGGNAH